MKISAKLILASTTVIMTLFILSGCGNSQENNTQNYLSADFNAPKTFGKAPFEARFTNDSKGTDITWEWDFGDGSKSSEQNPTHVYAKDGSYDVSLKVASINDTKQYKQLDYIIVGSDFSQVEAEGIVLKWKTDSERVHFILSAPTTGWVALGIDPDPQLKMAGADIIIGCVVDGAVTIRDDFGTDMYMHQPDTEINGTDSIISKGGKEQKDTTMISFELPLRNSEKTDKYLEPGKTYTIMLSYGSTDDMTKRHAVRTYSQIKL